MNLLRWGSLVRCVLFSLWVAFILGVLSLYNLHPFQHVEIVAIIVEWREYLNSAKFVGT